MKRRKPPQGFSAETKALIYARATDDEGVMRCEKCGSHYGCVEVHHRRPRQAGGDRRPETNLASNGLALDQMCHRWIESYRTESYEARWLLKSGQTPSAEPVLRRGVWVRLGDDGSITPTESEAA